MWYIKAAGTKKVTFKQHQKKTTRCHLSKSSHSSYFEMQVLQNWQGERV